MLIIAEGVSGKEYNISAYMRNLKSYWELNFYTIIHIFIYLYLYILFIPLISSSVLPFCLVFVLVSSPQPNPNPPSPSSSSSTFLPFFCPLFKAPLPNPKLTYPCYSYFIFLPFFTSIFLPATTSGLLEKFSSCTVEFFLRNSLPHGCHCSGISGVLPAAQKPPGRNSGAYNILSYYELKKNSNSEMCL